MRLRALGVAGRKGEPERRKGAPDGGREGGRGEGAGAQTGWRAGRNEGTTNRLNRGVHEGASHKRETATEG